MGPTSLFILTLIVLIGGCVSVLIAASNDHRGDRKKPTNYNHYEEGRYGNGR